MPPNTDTSVPVYFRLAGHRFDGALLGWSGTHPRDLTPGKTVLVRLPKTQTPDGDRYWRAVNATSDRDLVTLKVGPGPSIEVTALEQTAAVFKFRINPALLEDLSELGVATVKDRNANLLHEKTNEVEELRTRVVRMTKQLRRSVDTIDQQHGTIASLHQQIKNLQNPVAALNKATQRGRKIKL